MVVKALKEPERDRKKVKHVKHSGNVSLDEIIDIARQVRQPPYTISALPLSLLRADYGCKLVRCVCERHGFWGCVGSGACTVTTQSRVCSASYAARQILVSAATGPWTKLGMLTVGYKHCNR